MAKVIDGFFRTGEGENKQTTYVAAAFTSDKDDEFRGKGYEPWLDFTISKGTSKENRVYAAKIVFEDGEELQLGPKSGVWLKLGFAKGYGLVKKDGQGAPQGKVSPASVNAALDLSELD